MKRYITAFNLLLMTLLIYLGVEFFYTMITGKLEFVPIVGLRSQRIIEADSATPFPVSHYRSITERNLFKLEETGSDAAPKAVTIENLKQTELKLKLWGTVTGDGEEAYAVIEDSANREQNLYREGDSIQNAAVKHILREKVVLTVDGKDEILSMENMAAATPGAPQVGAPRPPPGTASPTRKIALNRNDLVEALQNVNTLMKQVRIRPHFRDGKPDGLVLTGIRPDSIFRKMGLTNGDILMGADEDDIRTVEDALKFYEEFKFSTSAKLQIRRRGRLQTMEYTIQ